MSSSLFLSQRSLYEDDYSCILRNPQNEFNYGLHYHDFYECVLYLGNAGIFRIEDQEYLIKRGDIVLIDMLSPTPHLQQKLLLREVQPVHQLKLTDLLQHLPFQPAGRISQLQRPSPGLPPESGAAAKIPDSSGQISKDQAGKWKGHLRKSADSSAFGLYLQRLLPRPPY